MRLKKLLSLFIVSIIFAGVLAPSVSAKDVDNFYFDDFTADYYFSQKVDGTSSLKVKERLTAVFPDYNQNKGICRDIPYTNQDGYNTTIDKPTKTSLNLKRNFLPEPVYSIDREGDYYEVCTGDDDYVTGRQIYTLEYEFYNVVTDFSDYQELYWDTNGTGWKQKFNSVTARVHFADDATKKAYDGKQWCYVGKYGISNQSRCNIKEISDGIEFSATKLAAYENLTFDIQLKAASFVVPEPPVTYAPIIIMCVVIVLSIVIIIFGIKKFIKKGEKRRFYNGVFVKPEYAPPKGFDIAPLSEIYIGKKKNVNVAILLKLIVEKRINLVKSEETGFFGGTKWEIQVVNIADIPGEEKITLKLLNGGSEVKDGDVIEIKRRNATSSTISLGKQFDNTLKSKLTKYGWTESNYKVGISGKSDISAVIIVFLFLGLTYVLPFIAFAFVIGKEMFAGMKAVGREYFVAVSLVSLVLAIIIRLILSSINNKYKNYSNAGLEMSRYMDGLKLYIEMAEAERLEFLQSVKNVDTSNEGIVKLYEKLLPYAAIFGLEKSWMKELEKYYALSDVTEPDWYSADFHTIGALSAITTASSYAGRASMSAGSGSSSSSHSGGGGGGFSGGGGGGGGGGGR